MLQGSKLAGLADISEAVGLTDDDHISLCWKVQGRTEAGFSGVEIHTPSSAAARVPELPEADVWFGVAPVGLPLGPGRSRGTENDVTWLPAVWADLDVKPGGCPDLGVANRIADEVSALIHMRPVIVIYSGHGIQPIWAIEGCEDGKRARALLRRFGRLVGVVAKRFGVQIDSVFDLVRILRVPGTRNLKAEPVTVWAFADNGGPLTVEELEEYFDEAGVYEMDDDRTDLGEAVADPSKWAFTGNQCRYAATALAQWQIEQPENGRHPQLVRYLVRLAAFWRLGCLADADALDTALAQIRARHAHLCATTATHRQAGHYEFDSAWKWAQDKVSRMDDDRLKSEAGQHDHEAVRHAQHLGWANRLATLSRGKILHVNGIGWHRWDGTRWSEANGAAAARRAVHRMLATERRQADKLPAEQKMQRCKEIAKYETSNAISGILTEAAVLETISATADEMDADPYLFNCANGTLDLRTGELLPHNPADRITRCARAAYHRQPVPAGQWSAFLAKVMPDSDTRDYLQRLTGLALVGKVPEHLLPIAVGSGGNGKTSFLEAVGYALGDYATTVDPNLLMAKHHDDHPTGIADLRGCRLVSTSETQRDRRLNLALVKQLTGGDRIKARRMRQDFFEFDPQHLLMMSTNHLPHIEDDSEAVWRRIRVLRFEVKIADAEKIPDLPDLLRLDADAILRWMVDGWFEYRRLGSLAEPESVRAATTEYREESDAISRFIEEECSVGPALSAQTKVLYARWEKWRERNGAAHLSAIAFGRAMSDKGYEVDQRTHGRPRRGICLRDSAIEGGWNVS